MQVNNISFGARLSTPIERGIRSAQYYLDRAGRSVEEERIRKSFKIIDSIKDGFVIYTNPKNPYMFRIRKDSWVSKLPFINKDKFLANCEHCRNNPVKLAETLAGALLGMKQIEKMSQNGTPSWLQSINSKSKIKSAPKKISRPYGLK